MDQIVIKYYQTFATLQDMKFNRGMNLSVKIPEFNIMPRKMLEIVTNLFDSWFSEITKTPNQIVATSPNQNVLMVLIKVLWFKLLKTEFDYNNIHEAFDAFIDSTEDYLLYDLTDVNLEINDTKFNEIMDRFSNYLPDFGTTAADLANARKFASEYAMSSLTTGELLDAFKRIIRMSYVE